MIRKFKNILIKWIGKFKFYFASNISTTTLMGPGVQILGLDNILINKNCTVGENTQFVINNRTNKNVQLTVGNNTYIGRDNFFSVGKSIFVGDYCIFGNKCSFICSDHIFSTPLVPYALSGNSYSKEIRIGVNCWFGHDVSVIGNVNIGQGCVIGAKSVITKSIPPFSMVVGNPARIIKTYNFIKNEWDAGEQKIESVYIDEMEYLNYLNLHHNSLPIGYHSASSKYGHI